LCGWSLRKAGDGVKFLLVVHVWGVVHVRGVVHVVFVQFVHFRRFVHVVFVQFLLILVVVLIKQRWVIVR
jgi:hypothetical protein